MLLECRVPRVKTEDNKIRQIDVPWAGKSNGFTLLFETLLMQLCCKIPVTMRLYVTEGKDHTTIERFAKDLEAHNGDRENITDVSCDMSPAFIKGVEKNLKNAKITSDKFHLVKIISEAVGDVRTAESKENGALKGTRNIFNKNRENITVAQLKYLQEKLQLKGLRLKTVRAFHLRKSFQEICQSETKNEFISRLNKWYLWGATHCCLEPMKKAAKTIKEHWNGVIRWYDSRVNNGTLERLNSLIQSAKSKARGVKTFKNFMAVIYLVTGDLDFTKVNAHYQPLTSSRDPLEMKRNQKIPLSFRSLRMFYFLATGYMFISVQFYGFGR